MHRKSKSALAFTGFVGAQALVKMLQADHRRGFSMANKM
jgi:hypothetical protein